MHIKCFRVQNFRRLKNALVQLEADQTIFVGANNSGKTSATHLFQMFLGKQPRPPLQIYDFTADCWDQFDAFDPNAGHSEAELPQIVFDLWFNVDNDNLHRVLALLPSLDWAGEPVGVRMVYAARDADQLCANYLAAHAKAAAEVGDQETAYRPWPQSMVEYLGTRISQEYEIKYYQLDAKRFNADFEPEDGYEPYYLGAQRDGIGKVMESIVRVDFLNAQRHLSDDESRGRSEDLSKRLSRFYQRNLDKLDSNLDELSVIAESEDRLNTHYAKVFGPTLARLGQVGYPGVANPRLEVKAEFNPYGILSSNAKVHYALTTDSDGVPPTLMLPDQYNGLGFKNLIFMVIEVLDFHEAWVAEAENRPPIHLVVIEEPEVHLHAQLQQVFISKILDILPEPEADFQRQLIATTHSPHIIYESDFTPIRYFCRTSKPNEMHLTEVKNLSTFYEGETDTTRKFLQQYIKLTHCDLFFADGAVLVEGNVERLLLPVVIERFVPDLRRCHLTILELGGAFAHRFKNLVTFLGLPTLVITDLDSVLPSKAGAEDDGAEDDPSATTCSVNTPGAVTSNQTLIQWIPKLVSIAELITVPGDLKAPAAVDGSPGLVRVAYQTAEAVAWQDKTEDCAGRTLEEAFALQNLEWTQSNDGKDLGLKIPKAEELSITGLHDKLFTRVRNLDKTRFALGVIAATDQKWNAPSYIVEGLEWLRGKLQPAGAAVAKAVAEQQVED